MTAEEFMKIINRLGIQAMAASGEPVNQAVLATVYVDGNIYVVHGRYLPMHRQAFACLAEKYWNRGDGEEKFYNLSLAIPRDRDAYSRVAPLAIRALKLKKGVPPPDEEESCAARCAGGRCALYGDEKDVEKCQEGLPPGWNGRCAYQE